MSLSLVSPENWSATTSQTVCNLNINLHHHSPVLLHVQLTRHLVAITHCRLQRTNRVASPRRSLAWLTVSSYSLLHQPNTTLVRFNRTLHMCQTKWQMKINISSSTLVRPNLVRNSILRHLMRSIFAFFACCCNHLLRMRRLLKLSNQTLVVEEPEMKHEHSEMKTTSSSISERNPKDVSMAISL